MNWKGDDDAVHPGAGDLREPGRLCNICREIAVLRIYERTGMLDDLSKSLEEWKRGHRRRFYAEHGFKVPSAVPQKGGNGEAFFSDCSAPAPKTAQKPAPREAGP